MWKEGLVLVGSLFIKKRVERETGNNKEIKKKEERGKGFG